MHETFRVEWIPRKRKDGTVVLYGPYTYAYRRQDGRLRKRYVGRGDAIPAADTDDDLSESDLGPLEAYQDEPETPARLLELDEAMRLIGHDPLVSFTRNRRTYRKRVKEVNDGPSELHADSYLALRKSWKLVWGERR